MKLHAAVLATAIFCGTARAGDGDWPQWRGPNRNGITEEKGLLKQWPKGGPPLMWKAKGFGEGYGTISTFGDLGYVLGDVGGVEGECFLFALKLSDGSIAWKAKVGGPRGKFKWGDPGARSTPTTDGKMVWALGPDGDLACFEATKGKELWRKNLKKDYGGEVGTWMYAESPLLDGDNIVCTPGGKQSTLVALKKGTGNIAWRSEVITDKKIEYTSLLPVEIGGVRQYVVLTKTCVAGIAAKDGKVLWKADRQGQVAICPTPLYDNGIVFVSSGYKVGCNAFAVKESGGRFSAKEIYSGKQIVNHHGDMILVDGHVYGLDDKRGLICINLETGKVVWEDKSVGKGSTVYADGHLVVRGEDAKKSQMALVEATPSGYKEKGRFTPPNNSQYKKWSHPVITGGRMYVRDHDMLYCYDVRGK